MTDTAQRPDADASADASGIALDMMHREREGDHLAVQGIAHEWAERYGRDFYPLVVGLVKLAARVCDQAEQVNPTGPVPAATHRMDTTMSTEQDPWGVDHERERCALCTLYTDTDPWIGSRELHRKHADWREYASADEASQPSRRC